MSDIIRVWTERAMHIEFDFEKQRVVFDQGQFGVANGSIDKAFNFGDITGIELKAPGLITLGQIFFIINGKNYVHSKSGLPEFSAMIGKSDFDTLENAVKRLSNEFGVEIRKKGGFNAPKENDNGQFDIVIKENEYDPNKEFRVRCNVCGKIYCYTNKDLENNLKNASMVRLSAVSAMTNAVSGTAYNANEANKDARAYKDKIIDYNKCPNCNSTDVTKLTDEEWEAEKNKTNIPTNNNSVADELKKFKELLDMGAITQEEFDAKKKQLLGL